MYNASLFTRRGKKSLHGRVSDEDTAAERAAQRSEAVDGPSAGDPTDGHRFYATTNRCRCSCGGWSADWKASKDAVQRDPCGGIAEL